TIVKLWPLIFTVAHLPTRKHAMQCAMYTHVPAMCWILTERSVTWVFGHTFANTDRLQAFFWKPRIRASSVMSSRKHWIEALNYRKALRRLQQVRGSACR